MKAENMTGKVIVFGFSKEALNERNEYRQKNINKPDKNTPKFTEINIKTFLIKPIFLS